MKKSMIAGLVVAVLAAALVSGCVSTPKGPTDEELIAQTVGAWVQATKAKNIDGMMSCYSQTFQHAEYGNKAGLQTFLKDALNMGYMENMEVATDKMATKIEKGEATVYPIQLKAAFGSATIEFVLKKEAGKWLIVGMTAEEN